MDRVKRDSVAGEMCGFVAAWLSGAPGRTGGADGENAGKPGILELDFFLSFFPDNENNRK